MSFRYAAVLTALVLLCSAAKAGEAEPRADAVSTILTLSPDATWRGTAGSSLGAPPRIEQVMTDAGSTNTGGGDGIAYGLQTISAVGSDTSVTGNPPQLTVPSTALMSDGDQFRVDAVDNGVTTGINGNWALHVVDRTHVDLCTSVTSAGFCVLTPAFYPSTATDGYKGGGKIWFDQTAIGAWDEHPNAWVESNGYTITVGAASNTKRWIKKVTFCLEVSTDCVDVTKQTISPTRPQIFGWSIQFRSRAGLDGIANAYAVITPVNGFQRVLGPFPVILNTNGSIPVVDRYVDNTNPAASDTSCDGTESCPYRTIEKATCAAFQGIAEKSRVVIHVGGPADTMYQENNTLKCAPVSNPYTITIRGTNPIYVTGATGADKPTSAAYGTWRIKAKNTVLENMAIDTEVGTFGTSVPGSMLWLGPKVRSVAWGGPAMTKYGAKGPEYGYNFPGDNGRQPTRMSVENDFVGIGESSFDTISALGFNLYRDTTATLSLDAIQYGQGYGAKTMLAAFNYRPKTGLYQQGFKWHNEPYLTVVSVGPCARSRGRWRQSITWSSPPFAAGAKAPAIGPDLITMLSGQAGNGDSHYLTVGKAGSYSADPPTTGPDRYVDSTSLVSTTASPEQALGCPPIAVGDRGITWYSGHNDCWQNAANGVLENVYFQNYECGGDNVQPYLLQAPIGFKPTLTTRGNTFAANPPASLNPDEAICLPVSDAAHPGTQGRRIASLHTIPKAQFYGSFVSGESKITVTRHSGSGSLVKGMNLLPSTSITRDNIALGDQISSSEDDGHLGGNGVYNIAIGPGGTGVIAYTSAHDFMGVGVDYGTLVAGFSVDVTSPTSFAQLGGHKDIACVNCLFNADYSNPEVGISGQISHQVRHLVFQDITLVNRRYAFSLRNDIAGFYAEATAFRDSIPGKIVQSSQNYPAQSSYPGLAVINGQYTSTSGSALVRGAVPFDAKRPISFSATDKAMGRDLPTVDEFGAAAVPWDNRMNPRHAGDPVGAVVR